MTPASKRDERYRNTQSMIMFWKMMRKRRLRRARRTAKKTETLLNNKT